MNGIYCLGFLSLNVKDVHLESLLCLNACHLLLKPPYVSMKESCSSSEGVLGNKRHCGCDGESHVPWALGRG